MLQRNFYFIGSLALGLLINLVIGWTLFFTSISIFFLRGNSPWSFYLPCLFATAIALGCARLFDKQASSKKEKLLPLLLKTYFIFSIGSISLNVFIHLFWGLKQDINLTGILTNFTNQSHKLFFFLLMGIPLCLFLGLAYFVLESSIGRREGALKKISQFFNRNL